MPTGDNRIYLNGIAAGRKELARAIDKIFESYGEILHPDAEDDIKRLISIELKEE